MGVRIVAPPICKGARSGLSVPKTPPIGFAIAGRAQISDAVSDALIDRGNHEIVQKLIANHGARISELGFVKLIGHAKTDKSLAVTIAKRVDMPAELEPFLKLTLA